MLPQANAINRYAPGKDLLQVAAHELGHSLGLSHSREPKALMAPIYLGFKPNLVLHSDDIAGIQMLYGMSDMERPDVPDTCAGEVDAITITKDSKTYAFKGNYFWELTSTDMADPYPQLIREVWGDLPGDLDAALYGKNKKTYFFKIQEKCRIQHQDLYMVFVDLTKAFDSLNRPLLWEVLKRFGCPSRFLAVLMSLHDGAMVRVLGGGEKSDPFPVRTGVRQGCVISPVIFNLHRAPTKVHQESILELQFADDAAVVGCTTEGLQRNLNVLDNTYTRAGLSINTGKTEVLNQSATQAAPTDFLIKDTTLKNVPSFTYLGSTLSVNCDITDEVQRRISLASASFGRLASRVFLNRNLTVTTKVSVYRAVCLSILLYASESWTLCRRHIRILEQFHTRCLQRILGLKWWHKVPHTEIRRRANIEPLETILRHGSRQLRWVGHTIRMPPNRLPRQVFYGSSLEGKDSYHRKAEARREKRHQPGQPQGEYVCDVCGRVLAARIGLISHQRTHGDQYWSYTNTQVDHGYPRPISRWWRNLPNDIDAAFFWSGNGKPYFTKDDQYYRYRSDGTGHGMDRGYPRDLAKWRGVPADGVDAAVQWLNGRTYFFKGSQYWRFNDRNLSVDPGYPRSTAQYWFGCMMQMEETPKLPCELQANSGVNVRVVRSVVLHSLLPVLAAKLFKLLF
ncbi:MMP17 [Branchiostoma lanceolatum]|uniref:MMP17 protein n=1 Tax=Branchiostoma lanceolatum TaxID=7740 RepID=A0A8J9ZZX6_BRALA|nr:MMP17 [Branchiostoma lanceolatum]